MTLPKPLPQCWGHRGASAAFPENTLASFERAIRDGAEAIETDIHVSRDGVPIMFHDPDLLRTTGVKGTIKENDYYGCLDALRTLKEPRQPIPTFGETLALLMKPENRHVALNLDIKVQNDALMLFPLLAAHIRQYPDHATALAPRILLGLWHPAFIAPAKKYLPECMRIHIGISPRLARRYFWDACSGFSIAFIMLATAEGRAFRKACRAAGKKLYVWTVNDPRWMAEAVRWGDIDAILTDKPNVWLGLRATLEKERTEHPQIASRILASHSRLFLWTSIFFWTPVRWFFQFTIGRRLTKNAGPLNVRQDPVAAGLPDVDIDAIVVPKGAMETERIVGRDGDGETLVASAEGKERNVADGTAEEMAKSLVPDVPALVEVSA